MRIKADVHRLIAAASFLACPAAVFCDCLLTTSPSQSAESLKHSAMESGIGAKHTAQEGAMSAKHGIQEGASQAKHTTKM
jgi:hypothetical protein